jgi:pimeloyl-ACP methyl ester carboxylesterase
MGGAIVQIIALKHSQLINKTIFSQSLIKIAPATRAALTAQLHLLQDQVSLRRVAETILPWLFSDALIDNPDFCESFLCLNEKNPNPPSPEALAKQLQAILKFDSRSWYSQILTPSLILFGDEDRLCPPNDFELMATRVCNAKHYIFRGVGHVAQIERPDEYCRVVCDFLK